MPNGSDPQPLGALQILVGLFAGVAALVYLTGGLVLGLRLLFDGLPGIGVVGQLPREFLFSVGATQVVVPAILLGAAAGVLEFGQGDRSIKEGHRPWTYAKKRPLIRRAYIRLYAAGPVVLMAPGVCVAITRDETVDTKPLWYAAVLSVAIAALVWWVTAARASTSASPKRRRTVSSPDDKQDERSNPYRLSAREWAAVLSGGFLSTALAAGLWLDTGTARYLGVASAWLISLLTVLLVVWLRGQLGRRYRTDRSRRSHVVLIALSWAATALFFVPSIVAIAGAWPLQPATVCSQAADDASYDSAGRFVGETKERVYIGDSANGRIISIPSAKVARLVFGRNAAHTALCERSRQGPK